MASRKLVPFFLKSIIFILFVFSSNKKFSGEEASILYPFELIKATSETKFSNVSSGKDEYFFNNIKYSSLSAIFTVYIFFPVTNFEIETCGLVEFIATGCPKLLPSKISTTGSKTLLQEVSPPANLNT